MTALRATYRLQLTAQQGFREAEALVPYLRDLGVSHLYLSPSLQARPESTHGYDVIDPRRLSQALGGEAAFRSLAGAARQRGMGIILDVVPNHMAASDQNRYWADPQLRAKFFDIDPVSGRHRRFFDIDDLAGVRMEDPAVFEETHELVLSLAGEELIDGLRVDHPDGLANPRAYLQALRDRGVPRVWVEKILDPGEHLRDWPVSGTVGYEFLNDACALFVDPAGEDPMTALWQEVSGDGRSFGEVAHAAKLEQIRGTFAPEVERLERELGRELAGGREVLEQALASLPVYRTYVEPDAGAVVEEDRRAVAGLDPQIQRLLLLEDPAPGGFVTRFQQTTPAVMAKGVEDTAFYRYGRLLALNDVGGDPSRFGITVERFHAGCAERGARFPQNLLTTQTHDAKRSGDVRARVGALASIPDEWARYVRRWLDCASAPVDGAPDRIERYFIFQTLIGAWPISIERVTEYMVKALREAKRNTNWIEPNVEWEESVSGYCRALVADKRFVAELEQLLALIAPLATRAALGQLALKLTAPGVPDVYQGDELTYRALVDPDNRRPVDWEQRRRLLAGDAARCPKLWLTSQLLALRARRAAAFSDGSYEPLDAGGDACVYMRGGEVVVFVAIRDGAALADAPGGRWREVLSGQERSFDRRQPIADVLAESQVAVFERV